MRSAFVYNFLIEANIMASIAIILSASQSKSWDTCGSLPGSIYPAGIVIILFLT